MGQAPRYRNLRDYLAVIRAYRIVIVACVILFGGIAAVVTIPQTPEYQAEAALNFQDVNQQITLLGEQAAPAQGTQQTSATVNAQFVESPSVARLAARKLRPLKVTPQALLNRIQAEPEASTGFVVIRARSTQAAQSAALANAFAQAADQLKTRREKRRLDRAAKALQRETKRTAPKSDIFTKTLQGERIARINALADFARPVEIARAADVPSSPASPKVTRTILLGLLVGLVLGIVVAFIRDVLDTRVRAASDVRRVTDLPLLGMVSQTALGRAFPGDGSKGTAERDRDAFRIVRTNLDFLSPDRPVRTVAVTSAVAGEGKTSVAAALARATAAVGRSALLVECDLRRPQLASRLGAEPRPGLADLLASRALTGDAIRHLSPKGENGTGERMDFIPVGDASESSLESLSSPVFADLLAVLSRSYDLVILDTTPILPVADTLQLLPLVDAVVLCARASRTTRDELRSAREALDRFAPRPCGVVLTGVRSRELGSYGSVYAAATPATG